MDIDYRRTGRTTQILKAMLKTKLHFAYFLSPNKAMAHLHFEMLKNILENNKNCPCCKQTIPTQELVVCNIYQEIRVGGKVFRFRNEDTFNFDLELRGLCYDIYRDHTCFERGL
jgi:hypothetical protein